MNEGLHLLFIGCRHMPNTFDYLYRGLHSREEFTLNHVKGLLPSSHSTVPFPRITLRNREAYYQTLIKSIGQK